MRWWGTWVPYRRFAPLTGACRPVFAGNSPRDCFPGARTPTAVGKLNTKGTGLPRRLLHSLLAMTQLEIVSLYETQCV